MMFVNPDDIPPEIRQEIERHMDLSHMQVESLGAEISRMFDEMPVEHLTAMRSLLTMLTLSGGHQASQIASHYDGYAAALLKNMHGVCVSCGKDHDKELLDAANTATEVDGQLQLPEKEDEPAEQFVLVGDVRIAADVYAAMEKYDLDFIGDPQVVTPDFDAPVQCAKCKHDFVSLKDRMMKPAGVEHCPGCIHKAKFG